MKRVVLKKGRDESLKRFHPWVFSGAVDRILGEPYEGEVVEVVNHSEEFMAYGHYQVGSITVRVLSFDQEYEPVDGEFELDFWIEKIYLAYKMRRLLGIDNPQTNCYRLVHGEGDNLPGLIIDYYDGVAVIQSHSAGMYLSENKICAALRHCYGPALKAVYDKSEGTAPYKAGLDLGDKYLWRRDDFKEEESPVVENGKSFLVNWEKGQKTGFFLDQRDNREMVGEQARGKRVLNLFCYTGGFSIYALAAGAKKVVSVDSSKVAMAMVDKNVAFNGFDPSRHESVCEDAIDYLKKIPAGEFDLMIVDPPAFAKHRGALDNALRAYKRLNASAIEKIAPGGIIFTYSCSQVVDKQAFALAVFSAAASVGRSVKILRRLTQPADHPVNIYHPEGEYLKGLMIYVE